MRYLRFPIIVLIVLASASFVIAAGELDTSFRASLLKVGGRINGSLIQPDGKILIIGEFNTVVTGNRKNIARLNPDGSLDTTFVPPAIVSQYTADPQPPILAIGLQSDGKIVIGGRFLRGLKRLNPDGSDDTAFNNAAWLDDQSEVLDLKIYPDDRIIYSGYRQSPSRNNLTILDPDGAVQTDSNFRASRFNIQPDQKVVLCDNFVNSLYRLNQDLTLDNTFSSISTAGTVDPFINSIIFQPDGKIVIGGRFHFINASTLVRVARLNNNGTVDTSFNVGAAGPNSDVNVLTYLPGGKILMGGGFDFVNGVRKWRIARLNSEGTLDPSFDVGMGFETVYDLDLLPDGRINSVGRLSLGIGGVVLGVIPSPVVRLDPDGPVDPSFNGPVGNSGIGFKVIVLPDNKILVGGDFNYAGGVRRQSIARFNADGSLDPTFEQTAVTANVLDFELFPDGKVVLAPLDATVRRLNTDGTLDTGFPALQPSITVKALPDGKMLISHYTGVLRKLNLDGTADASFSASVTGGVYKFELQPDGKILIGGDFSQVNGINRTHVARLNADGTTDLSFEVPGGVNGRVKDVDLQVGGKIIIAGMFTSVSFTAKTGIARLNSDGSLDTTFAAALNFSVESVLIQPDGRLLIGGGFNVVNGFSRVGYVRLHADGSLDTSFQIGSGADTWVNSIDLQSDGKIIMVGYFSTINGLGAPGIARILNVSLGTLYDYDGDSKSDISVFRPSNGAWYLQQSTAGFYGQNFGSSEDRITPADYDGDGKTDIAVYRPSSGVWYISNSSDGSFTYYVFGLAEDLPTPADYDGDGKADISVFRPSSGTWYRINSSDGGFVAAQFGANGDKPTIGDFDGDGKADIAVFRPSTGAWYQTWSSNGFLFGEQFGIGSDRITPADYDGDGKTDIAIYRPSEGLWYVKNSATTTYVPYVFGLAEDIPVPGDYDGDGKADIAVFRPSDGTWYIVNSSNGSYTIYQFGQNGDKPTQSAFGY